jgi:hypothetical protein
MKYANQENIIVYSDDLQTTYGVDHPIVQLWLSEGNTPEPADLPDPVVVEQQRIDRLWQAAHDYEFAQVSGSAIGLLAMGVMQGKPKCTAVQDWIKSIWTEYYTRKANGSTDYDYSFAGPVPYSVPELMAELGL